RITGESKKDHADKHYRIHGKMKTPNPEENANAGGRNKNYRQAHTNSAERQKRNWPEQKVNKRWVSEGPIILGRCGVAIIERASEEADLNPMRHLRAVWVAMVNQALLRSKPDGIKISAKRISIAEALRCTHFPRPRYENTQVVIDHRCSANNYHNENAG